MHASAALGTCSGAVPIAQTRSHLCSKRGAVKRSRVSCRCEEREVSTSGQDLIAAASCGKRELLLTAVFAAAAAAMPAAAQAVDTVPTQGFGEGRTVLLTAQEVAALTPSEKQVLMLNKRIQAQNRCPIDFPTFVREGFNIKVIGQGYQVKPNGLIYKDFEVGEGPEPTEGQEVVFDYTGYNESGTVIDSSYRQGRPAQTRLGINGLIPGFEDGIRSMRPGGKRRVVVPPELGPPVGPSTFFSAKQCEVFDVELRAVRTCQRRQVMMFSDVVCE